MENSFKNQQPCRRSRKELKKMKKWAKLLELLQQAATMSGATLKEPLFGDATSEVQLMFTFSAGSVLSCPVQRGWAHFLSFLWKKQWFQSTNHLRHIFVWLFDSLFQMQQQLVAITERSAWPLRTTLQSLSITVSLCSTSLPTWPRLHRLRLAMAWTHRRWGRSLVLCWFGQAPLLLG